MLCERLLDVSDLEPPEPLVLALGAVDALGAAQYLRLRHRRTPCLLYDNLGQRDCAALTRRGPDGHCEVFVWRSGDATAEEAARAAADPLAPWEP